MGLFGQNETHGLHVKNYAILMFSTHPERFIPHSDIEVIADTYGDESRMVAKTFTGPIWKQYYACLKYIQDNYLRQVTVRKEGVSTNRMVANYPYKAVEELLANAVVHKNYETDKSIQIYITEREIDIVNYNRPLPPVTLEDLNERTFFKERDAVNPEIRDMFKALGIIESFGTGVGEAKRACQNNGSGSMYYKIFPNNADVTSVVIRISDEFCELTNENMGTVAENKETDGEEKGIQDAWKAVRQKIRGTHYSSKVRNNMDKLLLEFKDSPFTPKDIMRVIHCSQNTATVYLSKLLELNLLSPIKGIGQSGYRFRL